MKRYDDAIDCFKTAVEKIENSRASDIRKFYRSLAFVYHNLGYSLGMQNKHEEAYNYFHKATEYFDKLSSPEKEDCKLEHADTWRNKGYSYARINYDREKKLISGQTKEHAINCVKKAIIIHPDFLPACNTLGHLYALSNNYHGALQYFELVLEKQLKPVSDNQPIARAQYNIGYSNYYLGKKSEEEGKDDYKDFYNKARDCLDESIKLDPDFAQSYYYKGRVLFDCFHKYEEALKNFDTALDKEKEFPLAAYDKGIVLMVQRKYEEALKCLQDAEKLFSHFTM